MKHIKYLSFILFITLFAACAKDDNAKLPEGIQKVNIPVIKKDANSQTNINFADIANFEGKYTVNYYFADGVKPEKADVVVIKNGLKNNPKVINPGVVAFPSSFSTNAAALEALFGQPTSLGDSYAIGLDLYIEGKKYEAFPAVGNAYGTAFNNLPGSSLTIKYDAVCPFNFDNYYGDFEVVSDDWQDYATGDVIQVSKVSDKAVSFNYNCSNPIPIVLNINSTTGAISGDKKEYCSYNLPPLTNFFGDIVEGKSSVDNCAKTLSVRILHSDANGVVYGEGTIVLKKK